METSGLNIRFIRLDQLTHMLLSSLIEEDIRRITHANT